ncbi:AAA family ATPase [Halomicrococcus sp. SG-WS-1]|uniref:AAA family ATPase n=1 Tax=Halomicrococcus sp. SG-WS-1 TaxID=3439057 RepID=UPI003F7926AA
MVKLYFHPVNEDWHPHFQSTVETPLDLSDAEGLPDELDHRQEARVWGTTYESKKARYHEEIEEGDIVLFSRDGRFFAGGRIQHSFRSQEFGQWAWNNPSSELVYTLTDFEEFSIPTQAVTAPLEYSEGYRVQGFMRPVKRRQDNLRSKFGSIEKAVESIKAEHTQTSVDGGQKALAENHETEDSTNAGNEDDAAKDLVDDESVTATAPYYWVNQSREELENEYLQAPRTDFPNYDLQKLEQGDVVFNYVDGEVVGYSEVTHPAYLVHVDGEEKRRVDIDVHLFDNPVRFVDAVQYLWREDVRLDRYYPVNHAGINQQYLFNLSEKAGDYLLEKGQEDTIQTLNNPDHPLVTQIQDEQPTVYKATSPPDYWLTAYEHAAVGLEEKDQEHWSNIDAGDVVVFHSRESPSRSELDDQESCLLGAGIVRATTTKPDDRIWWHDEDNDGPEGKTFSRLLTFERLYLSGDFDAIDHTKDLAAKAPATINGDLEALTSNALGFAEADDICNQASGSGFPRHRAIETLGTPDDHSKALAVVDALASRVTEVPPIALHKSFDGHITNDSTKILEKLHFPNGQGEAILAQVEGALRSGKHVIFTGPPGTGKTEIARRVADYLAREYPYLYSGSQVTTATSDWSTFDTVGGYMPNEDDTDAGNHLEFTPGLVLNRFKKRTTNTQRNDSLVIDELNRADIDKAFGQLFTVLSGQPVQLPYTKDGAEVELAPVDDNATAQPHEYHIPDSWNLFATLNTYDKTSLYEMSYAFMRRFAFIRVPEPDLAGLDDSELRSLLEDYADVWSLHTVDFHIDDGVDPLLDIGRVWQAANGAIDDRAIGPAVVQDILSYLAETTALDWQHRLTQAVISYILPQLEGVPQRKRVVTDLAAVDQIDQDLLDTASRDMLQVAASQDDG